MLSRKLMKIKRLIEMRMQSVPYNMTVVLVHGAPETSEVWNPLRKKLRHETIALSLPGFGSARPAEFTGTKDAYAEWLVSSLARLDKPVDLVSHDFGALLTMRLATAFDCPSLRSWNSGCSKHFSS